MGFARKKPIRIESVTITPPVVPEGGIATIKIVAKSTLGHALTFSVSASEGTVEPTAEPNVFLWRAPRG